MKTLHLTPALTWTVVVSHGVPFLLELGAGQTRMYCYWLSPCCASRLEPGEGEIYCWNCPAAYPCGDGMPGYLSSSANELVIPEDGLTDWLTSAYRLTVLHSSLVLADLKAAYGAEWRVSVQGLTGEQACREVRKYVRQCEVRHVNDIERSNPQEEPLA